MNLHSSSERPRKSPASPTAHPSRSSLRRSSFRMSTTLLFFYRPLESGQRLLSRRYNQVRGGSGLFAEDVQNYHGLWRDVIDDSPILTSIDEAQLMAAGSNAWHGPGTRQTKYFSFLQASQEKSSLDSHLCTERGRLDFSAQPNQRLVTWTQRKYYMSHRTYRQAPPKSALLQEKTRLRRLRRITPESQRFTVMESELEGHRIIVNVDMGLRDYPHR